MSDSPIRPSSERLAERVLLIGWDAADWRILHPLIDAGKMPALEGMVNAGVIGNLSTLHPVLSPMLWTSIATGMRPYKHGILGFTEPGPDGVGQRPITNLSRRTKAIWNILSQSGLRSNVVGWWPSYPAEPIAGVMVSNHFQHAPGRLAAPWPMPPGTLHPVSLAGELADCRFHPEEIAAEHILPFVPNAARVDQEKDRRLASIAKIVAEAATIQAATTHLLDHTDWDFTAVYFDAIDHFCHGFMKYHPPRRDFVREEDFDLYRGVVEAGYRFHDLMLNTLLSKVGEDTAVIIVSDHGFHPDHMRPDSIPLEPAGPAVEHRDLGMIAMRGPGTRRDEIVHGASLLDVTPTILAWLGLPVGDDMDGKPLLSAFETPPEIRRIPSWEEVPGQDGRHPPESRFDVAESSAAMEQLVALGYVDAPDEDAAKSAQAAIGEQQFNRARSLMDASHHGEAAPILERLRKNAPDELRFGIQLAMCYRVLGRIAELRALVEDLSDRRRNEAKSARRELQTIASERKRANSEAGPSDESPAKPDEADRHEREAEAGRHRRLAQAAVLDEAALDFLMGFVLTAEEKPREALEYLRRAERAKASRPALHVQIGEVYLQLREWEDAERSFRRATGIDPENPHAELGVARSLLPRRKNRLAAEAALSAVALLHEYPMAHYCLGIALHRMGRIERAVEALGIAVSQNPNFVEAHERLARIYRRRLKDPDRAAPHEEMAVLIRYGLAHQDATTDGPATHARVAAAERDRTDYATTTPDPSEVITIVSGLPRSGTSLMMQMLAAGGLEVLSDGRREADDDNPRGYYELEKVMALRRDSSWIGDARGKAVKVIAQLVPYLPPGFAYRVILMERELDEVLASQARMLERRGSVGAAMDDSQLADAFEKQLKRMRAGLERRKIPMQVVRYREALDSSLEVAERLSEFCGCALDTAKMARAVDPKLYRQRRRA